MHMVQGNFLIENQKFFVDTYGKKTESQEGDNTFYDVANTVGAEREKTTGKAVKESVVEKYKREHPKDASHVSAQVNAGKNVRRKNGVEHISTEDMTMEEYKYYFNSLLQTIPYHPTRLNDDVTIFISEEGWEQMKSDPEYEAWVLGYFVEDRAVPNPFLGWGGNRGSVVFEHFGASIEEHHGEGFCKTAPGCNEPAKKKESWWDKRQKRMRQALKEQAAIAQKKAEAEKKQAQREYLKQHLESNQRLHNFLTAENQYEQRNLLHGAPSIDGVSPVYVNMLSILSRHIVK